LSPYPKPSAKKIDDIRIKKVTDLIFLFNHLQINLSLFLNNRMRTRYAENVKSLGARMNNHCTYSVAYNGPAFAPIQELKASYQGPNID